MGEAAATTPEPELLTESQTDGARSGGVSGNGNCKGKLKPECLKNKNKNKPELFKESEDDVEAEVAELEKPKKNRPALLHIAEDDVEAAATTPEPELLTESQTDGARSGGVSGNGNCKG